MITLWPLSASCPCLLIIPTKNGMFFTCHLHLRPIPFFFRQVARSYSFCLSFTVKWLNPSLIGSDSADPGCSNTSLSRAQGPMSTLYATGLTLWITHGPPSDRCRSRTHPVKPSAQLASPRPGSFSSSVDLLYIHSIRVDCPCHSSAAAWKHRPPRQRHFTCPYVLFRT